MTRILQVALGPYLGRKVAVAEGSPVSIGRTEAATYAFPSDVFLSRVHATLEWRPDGCLVRDKASTNGTFFNDERITEVAAKPGERLLAGKTLFLVTAVTLEDNPREKKPPAIEPRLQKVAATILKEPPQRYALIDAAQDDAVVEMLKDSHVNYQSLYEGPEAEELANAGPYLASLPEQSALFHTLLQQGWGKNWAVYLSTAADFDTTRRHLRRFLTVETEEGQKLFFRFYDPRILQIFLPTCTPEEYAEFFGPIGAWLMESETGDVIRFTADRKQDDVRKTEPPRTVRYSSR